MPRRCRHQSWSFGKHPTWRLRLEGILRWSDPLDRLLNSAKLEFPDLWSVVNYISYFIGLLLQIFIKYLSTVYIFSSIISVSLLCLSLSGFPGSSDDKESACNVGDPGSIPGSGKFSGERNGNPLQYSCLGNPMDRGAWRATVRGVT